MTKRNKRVGSGAPMVGRTLAGELSETLSESERLAARKKARNRKIVTAVIAVVMVFGVAIFVLISVQKFLGPEPVVEVVTEKIEPTVEIIDESGSGFLTERMREYVGRVERDFADSGYMVTKAVVPTGKMREVDIYVDGRTEYYKMSLDRGTAVSVEDAVVMMKYLEERGIAPGYVDVRIEGRAYYK